MITALQNLVRQHQVVNDGLALVRTALQRGERLPTLEVGTATNKTVIEADGTIRFVGDATVFDDIVGGIAAAKTQGPGVSLNDAECTLDFVKTADLNDYAWLPFQIEHKWKLGSVVFPHLHWEQAAAQVPNWLFQYRWQRQKAAKTTAWTNIKTNTVVEPYVSGTLNQISYGTGITPPEGYSMSDILQIRLLRDTGNTSTLFTGADTYNATAAVTSYDVHVECDTGGSHTEYTK